MLRHPFIFFQVFNEVCEFDNTEHGNAIVLFHFLDGGEFTATFFLSVQGYHHPRRFGACRRDDVHGLADSGAGGDYVVNNQHPVNQRAADDVAAFTVILGLFTVEAEGDIAAVMFKHGHGGRGTQRDALVGRAEQHIKAHTAVDDGIGIVLAQFGQQAAGIEQAGIEEVGADTARFEGELTKAQYIGFDGKINKFFLVILHGPGLQIGSGSGMIHPFGNQVQTMRVITANVNGIRSAESKGFFQWLARQKADVVCIQETKAQEHQLDPKIFCPNGFHCYYFDAQKKGYSGTALYCRKEPDEVHYGLGWDHVDTEGRYIQADFGNLSVASLYLPSGSASEERHANKLRFMDKFLEELATMRRKKREYIITGDWNTIHKEIDIRNFKSNQKTSGCTPPERAWMDKLFDETGWVDAFRVVDERPEQYTWWSNRGQAYAKNVGWRIDYQIITPGLQDKVLAARIYKDKKFSDHAPLIMDYAVEL